MRSQIPLRKPRTHSRLFTLVVHSISIPSHPLGDQVSQLLLSCHFAFTDHSPIESSGDPIQRPAEMCEEISPNGWS